MDINKEIEEMRDQILCGFILARQDEPALYLDTAEGIAKWLVSHGYRKQSDVAREIFEEIENNSDILDFTCDNNAKTEWHWGEDAYEELKKNYIED